MRPAPLIRDETPGDYDSIDAVTIAAFQTLAISNQTEHLIVRALREAGALSLSLVAEIDGRVVGHIAFSPVEVSDGTPGWFGLGPVSVLPELHRQGIGKALVDAGLARLKQQGAGGCCVVGHPEYYPKFGFCNAAELTMADVPPEVFFVLPFGTPAPRGSVRFHPAFAAHG